MIFEGLNKEQIAAIIPDENILVTACPGSGKTRVLAHKAAYELEKIATSKKKIIAVTFTNRAAEEIKNRIFKLNIDDSKLWAGTIHSFCLDWILRPYMCYLNEIKNGFVIADEFKTEDLLNNLKKKHGITYWQSISLKYLANGELEEEKNKIVVKEYHELLKENKLIDFDQILYFSYKILAKYSSIPKILNNLIHLICVDEYQDTQELQYAILAEIIKIKNGSTKIFMVGDIDQAIYGSLGGVAKSLEEIKSQFKIKNILPMKLPGNYRTNQQIIDFYKNFQSSTIDIVSLCDYAKEKAIITYDKTIDITGLDRKIADLISSYLNKGIEEKEICVLAPQWWLIIPMGRKLRNHLPQVNFDAIGLSPLQRNKENIWFKIARLFLAEPSTSRYFSRRRWANELIDEFESINIDLFSEKIYKAKKLLKVINSINSTEELGVDYLSECFNKLMSSLELKIDDHIYLQEHWKYFFESTNQRLDNPDLDHAKDTESFKKMFKHKSGVVVNTCHGIKGEEFKVVIAFGLLDGYLPNWNESDKESAALKLLYVICSRAKHNLHLISETGRKTKPPSSKPYLPTKQLSRIKYNYN
jgi:DNA helicase II / ATP-dependent DNA helicase PcrA